jgi:hypothetical protein
MLLPLLPVDPTLAQGVVLQYPQLPAFKFVQDASITGLVSEAPGLVVWLRELQACSGKKNKHWEIYMQSRLINKVLWSSSQKLLTGKPYVRWRLQESSVANRGWVYCDY